MNRLTLFAILCLAPAIAGATELRPGTLKLSGATDLHLSRVSAEVDGGDESDITELGLSTRGFWFFTPNVGVGAAADVLRQTLDVGDAEITATELTVGPALALHLPLDGRTALFAEIGAGLTRSDVEDIEIDGWVLSGRGGVSIFARPERLVRPRRRRDARVARGRRRRRRAGRDADDAPRRDRGLRLLRQLSSGARERGRLARGGPRSIQHGPHPAEERGGRERLREQLDAGRDHPVARDDALRVPGHVEHPQRGTPAAEPLGERAPVEPGHDDVGQQQVDRRGLGAPPPRARRRRPPRRARGSPRRGAPARSSRGHGRRPRRRAPSPIRGAARTRALRSPRRVSAAPSVGGR